MTQTGSGALGGGGGNLDGSGYNNLGDGPEGRERGSRRRKIAGYLKAANELRQSYQSSAAQQWSNRNAESSEDPHDIPGAFPDVSIVRSGHEELILFPSYCKRHQKMEAKPQESKSQDGQKNMDGTADAEWWKQEWEKWEDDKAIVDVDVRGWVYSPHRGPMSRKNRVLVGLARQLSGIPAQKPEKSKSRESSPEPHSLRARHEAHEALREQEKITREAEEILRKGEKEGHIAERGGYSEGRKDISDTESTYSDRRPRSHSQSPFEEGSTVGQLHKRTSWNHPSDMGPAELAKANTNLMARLMPFLTIPLVSVPITVFFYDEHKSQSKTVQTDEAGHFNLRAPLDFVPTHVRVLASENLSATEEVKISEPKGVSLISDVDDTIKHSSIGSGAREIFRNAFIRDLGDLTIDGVKEWYNTMYDMGAGIHYVSNSPWQLFPVLVTFFQAAGLPPGSYHLKQYSGMLQGIFEPVAERKKGTLERIMRDFPERKFLLIGDSGEADLEVYTDVVLANPGRVIGVFIRDVTTPTTTGFFDSSMGPLNGDIQKNKKGSRGWSGDSSSSRKLAQSDSPGKRPPLPSRMVTEATPKTSTGPSMGKLIDFDEEPQEMSVHEARTRILPRSNSDLLELASSQRTSAFEGSSKIPPRRPVKPIALRSGTADGRLSKPITLSEIPPPPPPRRQPTASNEGSSHPLSQTQSTSKTSSDYSYISSARQKVASAYNSLPPASSYIPGMSSTDTYQGMESNKPTTIISSNSSRPVPPPRRGVTAASAAYANNRVSWNKSADSSEDDSNDPSPRTPPVNKKLDLWKRRWKRAKELLDAQGVELRAWRVGEDVSLDAIQLIEKNMREMGVEGYGKGKIGEGGGEKKVKETSKPERREMIA